MAWSHHRSNQSIQFHRHKLWLSSIKVVYSNATTKQYGIHDYMAPGFYLTTKNMLTLEQRKVYLGIKTLQKRVKTSNNFSVKLLLSNVFLNDSVLCMNN